jgi:hypothetical protein
MVAVVLAAGALRRTTPVRLAFRRDPVGGLVILTGATAAAALGYQAQHEQLGPDTSALWLPDVWTAVLALAVPMVAAWLVSRRLAAALLAGWVGGGLAMFLRFMNSDYADRGSTVVFGVTLLVLAILAVPLGRGTRPETRRPRPDVRDSADVNGSALPRK